jgi:hypothetical protein
MAITHELGSRVAQRAFLHAAMLALLTTFHMGASAQTQVVRLSPSEVYSRVELGGVPHLVAESGWIVYPAFCPTACTAAWEKIGAGADNVESEKELQLNPLANGIEGNHHIGAIKIYFPHAGDYRFDYFVEPIAGKFHDLRALQVIVIPDRTGELPLKQVIAWDQYSYTKIGGASFSIKSPGRYVIGFGPAYGMVLTELETQGIPIGFNLKYRVTPNNGWKIAKSDMDLILSAGGKNKSIKVQSLDYDALANLPKMKENAVGWARTLQRSGISEDRSDWLVLRGFNNVLYGGSSLKYPLGRNANLAAQRIKEIQDGLPEMREHGNGDALQITIGKVYSYILTINEDASKKGINAPDFEDAQKAFTSNDYDGFLRNAESYVREVTPKLYPEWQKKTEFTSFK